MKPEKSGLLRGRLAAALVGLVLSGGESAAQGDRPAVMFVLDASVTMQSVTDGKAKIVHVRDAVSEIAVREGGRRLFGLTAFGMRGDPKSCTDAQIVSPLNKDGESFRAAVQTIEPKGGAPIGEALKAATDAIARTGKPGAVALIADSGDTCNVNLCTLAKTIKEKSPETTIHVIGFVSSQPEKVEGLACVAEATGGRFTVARNRHDLNHALAAVVNGEGKAVARAIVPSPIETTLGNLFGGRRAPPQGEAMVFEPQPEPEPMPVAAEPEPAAAAARTKKPTFSIAPPLSALATPRSSMRSEPQAPKISDILAANGSPFMNPQAFAPSRPAASGGKASMTLSAAAAENTPALKGGVVWHVFKAEKDQAGSHPLVLRSEQAAPTIELDVGEYIVHCSYGKAQATKRIQLGAQAVAERLTLNAGALKLSAVVGEDRPIGGDLVSFAIYRDDPEKTRQNVLVAPLARPGETIRLTEGGYHVISHYGDGNATVRANVRVEAGKVTEAMIYHKAARVTLKLVGAAGGEAIANTSWAVMTKAGRMVRESVGAFPSHVLAAGDYTIVAYHDGKTFKRDVKIETGGDGEIEVMAKE